MGSILRYTYHRQNSQVHVSWAEFSGTAAIGRIIRYIYHRQLNVCGPVAICRILWYFSHGQD